MASGTVESYKYVSADSPVEYSYTQSFAAGRTQTTAATIGLNTIPAEYYCTFLGFDVNHSAVIIQAVNPNASSSTANAMTNYNIGSSLSGRSCRFNRAFVLRDMISGLS